MYHYIPIFPEYETIPPDVRTLVKRWKAMHKKWQVKLFFPILSPFLQGWYFFRWWFQPQDMKELSVVSPATNFLLFPLDGFGCVSKNRVVKPPKMDGL